MKLGLSALLVGWILLPCSWAQTKQAEQPVVADSAAEARKALFLDSNLPLVQELLEKKSQVEPNNPELQFLRMEQAALRADTLETLQAALRVCELTARRHDTRATIAASRILDLAGNTAQFRTVIPRVRHLITLHSPLNNLLRAALLTAAADGSTGLSLSSLTRESGLLSEWRVAGPFGKYPNVDFDRKWSAENDQLRGDIQDGKPVERLRFEDGTFNLPDYFGHAGVFYASSVWNTPSAVQRLLRVESPGTLEIFVDGNSVLRKDDRFRQGPEIEHTSVRLKRGSHTFLIKFIPASLPFRVALVPVIAPEQSAAFQSPTDEAASAEAAYISAAQRYWSGDYSGATAELTTLNEAHPSAVTEFLLASAWNHATDDSPEGINYLLAALKLSPTATAAEFALAQDAKESGRPDEAWQRLQRVIASQPDYSPAQQMAASIAISRNWTVESISALEAELRVHPSCAALQRGYRFYSGHQQFEAAHEIERRLENCAPHSSAYVDALSDTGDHQQAAQAAARLVSADAMDRSARFRLVRELALAGEANQARSAAVELAAIAPNSAGFLHLATAPEMLSLLDEDDGRSREIVEDKPFYAPYRRDPLKVVKEGSEKKYSGGPLAILLDEKVSHLDREGRTSVYVHRIQQVLNREGIETYGEVALPNNADILELRTIRQDGSIAEPEIHQHKATISMPALAPGDCIEQEYVIHHSDYGRVSSHPADFTFTFGSFRAPVMHARFVAITPTEDAVTTQESNGAPAGKPDPPSTNTRVQVWTQDDLAQFTEERFAPPRAALPTVRVLQIPQDGWHDIRDYYRDLLIDASRLGPRVESQLLTLELNGKSDTEKILAIYKFVATRIRSDSSSFGEGNVASAEDTLSGAFGNRTTTFIALARAAGLEPELLLGRDLAASAPVISRAAYTRPLIRIRTHSSADLLLDMETEGMGLGSYTPVLDRGRALMVPVTSSSSDAPLVALSAPAPSEESIAEGEVHLNAAGDLDAHVIIRLGSWRAAQMRTMIGNVDASGRKQFFQQLAGRIFPGTDSADGEIHHQFDFDRPLELVFNCRAAHFVDLSTSQVLMDQIVPALGLSRMYSNSKPRVFPLYVDTPFVERTTFRISLPPNAHFNGQPSGTNLNSVFGRYAIWTREIDSSSVEITREFDIPVQVITPGRYADFSEFASSVEQAERQRFTLTVNLPETSVNAGAN